VQLITLLSQGVVEVDQQALKAVVVAQVDFVQQLQQLVVEVLLKHL
jgi:uncharacterized membrane protein (Fun14 family)